MSSIRYHRCIPLGRNCRSQSDRRSAACRCCTSGTACHHSSSQMHRSHPRSSHTRHTRARQSQPHRHRGFPTVAFQPRPLPATRWQRQVLHSTAVDRTHTPGSWFRRCCTHRSHSRCIASRLCSGQCPGGRARSSRMSQPCQVLMYTDRNPHALPSPIPPAHDQLGRRYRTSRHWQLDMGIRGIPESRQQRSPYPRVQRSPHIRCQRCQRGSPRIGNGRRWEFFRQRRVRTVRSLRLFLQHMARSRRRRRSPRCQIRT
jgi:hypothetical protein